MKVNIDGKIIEKVSKVIARNRVAEFFMEDKSSFKASFKELSALGDLEVRIKDLLSVTYLGVDQVKIDSRIMLDDLNLNITKYTLIQIDDVI